MAVDISELVAAVKEFPLVFADSVKVEEGVLVFGYAYLSHLPDPFEHRFDIQKKELHLVVQQDAFPFGSGYLVKRIPLPAELERVKIEYKGEDIRGLTFEEKLFGEPDK